MSKEQVMDYVMNSPANTNPNVLSGMLDGISGTQLPSPTESDNGKVLGVDGGEYKLVEQNGGSDTFFVDVVWENLSSSKTPTMTTAIEDVLNAVKDGKRVIAKVSVNQTSADVVYYMPLTSVTMTSSLNMLYFDLAKMDGQTGYVYSLTIMKNTSGATLTGTAYTFTASRK